MHYEDKCPYVQVPRLPIAAPSTMSLTFSLLSLSLSPLPPLLLFLNRITFCSLVCPQTQYVICTWNKHQLPIVLSLSQVLGVQAWVVVYEILGMESWNSLTL